MTNDPEAAKTFYGAVVGWETESFSPGDKGYTILKAGGRGIGGILPMPEGPREAGARAAWLGYVAVPDIDQAAREIEAAGGALHRDIMDIPHVGRVAMVSDPQGAAFYLIAPAGEDQPPAPRTTPGHVGWHELHTNDWQAAVDFYARQFGWVKTEALDMGPMGTYQLFSFGGANPVGGMMNDASFPRPAWLFYFVVEDIDAGAERITGAGGKIMQGPMEVPGGAFVINAIDPQGAMFAIVGMRG